MAGKLGNDFDRSQPSDTSLVKRGAAAIRDIKGRLKAFCEVLFDLETGEFKDNVVSSAALQDSGVTPGTYRSVTVNEKGVAIGGSNPVIQQSADVYRAIFLPDGTASFDTSGGLDTLTGTANGSSQYEFAFTVPDGVRRVKAIIVGGGGGGHTSAGGGGGGAEHVETTFPVTPSSTIAVYVGTGGGAGVAGGKSKVDVGSLLAEADRGEPGTGGAGGAGGSDTGTSSGTLTILRCPGGAGATVTTGGLSGSYIPGAAGKPYGKGGDATVVGEHGIVILEWLV